MLFSKIIKKKFDAVLGRYDADPALYYFSPADFPDVKTEPFRVQGSQGTLQGHFYYRDTLSPEKLIVFDHGTGAGHLAYFQEIVFLTQNGYTVFAYDHTGCGASEGTGILGFAQGINDLDHVVTAIRNDSRFSQTEIKLIGHSWGGYCAMNAAGLHPEISHVVSLAGYLSAKSLIEQYLPKFVMKYSAEVMDRERRLNPRYADLDARDSMKKSRAKLLYFQSRDDKKVKYELGFELLQEALKNRENTDFISLDRHNHDPQRTEQAAAAAAQMEEKLAALRKKHPDGQELDAFRNSQNWQLITRQDPETWNKILEFLAS